MTFGVVKGIDSEFCWSVKGAEMLSSKQVDLIMALLKDFTVTLEGDHRMSGDEVVRVEDIKAVLDDLVVGKG
jgi:hypothetical protein